MFREPNLEHVAGRRERARSILIRDLLFVIELSDLRDERRVCLLPALESRTRTRQGRGRLSGALRLERAQTIENDRTQSTDAIVAARHQQFVKPVR